MEPRSLSQRHTSRSRLVFGCVLSVLLLTLPSLDLSTSRTETLDEVLARLRRLPPHAREARLRVLSWKYPELAEGEEPAQESTVRLEAQGFSPGVRAGYFAPGTQSETSIAAFGSRVVVGFNQLNERQDSGVSFSTDAGATYTDTGGLPPGPGFQIIFGDPSVTACGDGRFYYSSLATSDWHFPDSSLVVSVGTFSGSSLSWTDPIRAIYSTQDSFDKEWLTCDRATNTLYMIYVRFVGDVITEQSIELIKSTDGGASWSNPKILAQSTTETLYISYVATGPNGEVYTLWERGLEDLTASTVTLEFRRSLNGGNSFNQKTVVRSMTPSFFPAQVGFNRDEVWEVGTLAVDKSTGPHRGNIYVIWSESEPGDPDSRDLFVSTSTDRGDTWSAPVRVNDDPPGSDQVDAWLSVNSQGTVEAVWYDYRNWPRMNHYDVYAARSTDGGATFGPNFRVTKFSTNAFVPSTITPNLGDYLGCTSEGTEFYAAWADGLYNDIDVFATHIPTATCGNGTLDPFEECDDGNVLDGDSCSGSCISSPCGNSLPDGAEQCDDGNIRNGDGCSQICLLEICGDGIVQANNREECDDGNVADGDGCSATCQIELDKMAWVVEERSRLVLESIVTGQVQQVGDPMFHAIGDLAFAPSGSLFGGLASNFTSFGMQGSLVAMSTLGLPGRGQRIGPTGWSSVVALDFHPFTGVLYGIVVDALGASHLVTLDPATGATLSNIAELDLMPVRAMAFDSTGTLYVAGLEAFESLSTVDLVTGVRTFVAGMARRVSGIAFAPDGSLYGVVAPRTGLDGGLIRINPAQGTTTIVSIAGRADQAGIRFAPAIAVDRDLDGVHDVADCAPADPANPPPGLTSGLQFVDAQAGRFSWLAATNANFHDVYRGTISGPMASRLPGSVYDHLCFESHDALGDGDLTSTDPALPPLGTVYYYLTSGERCGEGALDTDAGHPIPNPSACPTPP